MFTFYLFVSKHASTVAVATANCKTVNFNLSLTQNSPFIINLKLSFARSLLARFRQKNYLRLNFV